MRAVLLLTSTLLTLPTTAFSSYSPETIKEAVTNSQSLFSVKEWKSDKPQQWEAETGNRLLSIKVGPKLSLVKSPYISPRQKMVAKKRCVEFGKIGANAQSKSAKKEVETLVKRATQKHITLFKSINNVRFEVHPEMKGVYVSLICRLKPSN